MPGFISDDEMEKLEAGGEASPGPSFISDEEMASMEEAVPLGESAVNSFVDSATGGFLDEIKGGAEGVGAALGIKGLGGPFKNVGLTDEGPTMDWGVLRDAYQRARDAERGLQKKTSEANPITAGAASVAGMIASPINKIGAGASLAKQGAMLGGITGLGSSEGETLREMAGDAMIGAGLGAGAGKLAGAVGPTLKKGVDSVGESFGGAAEMFGARALGAERGSIKKLGADKVRQAGRYALDEGIISPLASTDDLIQRNLSTQSQKLEGAGAAGLAESETAESLLANKFAREEGNNALGLTDWGVISSGFGGPGTMATLAAKKGIEKYGSQNAALGFDKVSKAMLKSPAMQQLYQKSPMVFNKMAEKMAEKMGAKEESSKAAIDTDSLLNRAAGSKFETVLKSAAERGQSGVASTHFLLQQTDPEYRKVMMEEERDEDLMETQDYGS